MESGKSVSIEDLPTLKKEYDKAVQEKKEMFVYKGVPLLVSYAKYLIEYMEDLKKRWR